MTSLARYLLTAVTVLLAAAVLAGCSDSSDDSDTSTTSKTTKTTEEAGGGADDAAAVEASLQVQLTEIGGDAKLPTSLDTGLLRCTKSIPATCQGEVTCPPAADGPSAEHDAAVCAWLAGDGAAALAATGADDEVCTQIYGGPEVAKVTGTLDGEEVDASFTRGNGCEIARFDAVMPVWTGVARTATIDVCTTETPDPDAPVSSSDSDVACSSPAVPPADAGAPPSVDPPPAAEVIADPPEAFER